MALRLRKYVMERGLEENVKWVETGREIMNIRYSVEELEVVPLLEPSSRRADTVRSLHPTKDRRPLRSTDATNPHHSDHDTA